MYIEKITAPESIMSIMEMHTPAPIYKVQRVQTADGVPIALMTNYVKCSYTPGLEHYIDGFTSFYSFLEKKYKIIFSNAVQYLSAVSANFTESQILENRLVLLFFAAVESVILVRILFYMALPNWLLTNTNTV